MAANGLSAGRQIAVAARWPGGVALTMWRYLWRTTPMHRSEVEGDPFEDQPPPLPAGFDRDRLQVPADGRGPLFHRLYRARISSSELSAEELIGALRDDPDQAAPREFATFQKAAGADGRMIAGDEYVVRMAAPWDGPVRVVEAAECSFRLATLDGHLEAGQIEFRAEEEGDVIVFEIESWARSKDRITDVLYDRLHMTKEVQLHMWTSTLEGAGRMSGGRLGGGIEIRTRKVSEEDLCE